MSTILAGILGRGMVIQRDEPFVIWGKDDSSSEVIVIFENKEYKGAVSDGKFRIELPAHPAGTDLTITVRGSSEIVIEDVCFGEVFMLAGQSNMELPVGRTLDISAEEVAASCYPNIRQYRLTPQYRLDESKETDLPDLPWTKAVPDEIMEMSAAGFFCAKNLDLDIPIGLILNAQGGSTLETWMPEDLLSKFADHSEIISRFKPDNSVQEFIDLQNKEIGDWRDALMPEDPEKRASFIPEGACEVIMPHVFLEREGEGYTGSMWLYKEVEIDVEPDPDSFIYVGELIDSDQTYINGHLVGRTEYCYPPRKYPFDGSILKKGKNLIAVRLEIDNKNGGFLEEHSYYLRTGNTRISLEGPWLRVNENRAKEPCHAFIMGQTIPTALYTASIKTLFNVRFKGIWWYQGESNAEHPSGYDQMFKAMVERWRKEFGQRLPIVVVEMPDYINPANGEDENWYEIQRMQREAPSMIDDCACVHAKDLGQPYELHPQLKSELGRRMAVEVKKLML